MHTVMWTFQLPAEISKRQVTDIIGATAPAYQGVPGLIRKYYGLTSDGDRLVGIYLWENRAAADAFYTDGWKAAAAKRWAATPQRQDWETPMVVESAERRLIAAE